MEKLIERHIKKTSLIKRLIHTYQRACEFALHQLVGKIEDSLNTQKIALTAFLHIKGAFNNIRALTNHGIEDAIYRRGCLQGGVLFHLFLNFFVDKIITHLNDQDYYTQGYADNLVILIRGKHPRIISKFMHKALKMVRQCKAKGKLNQNSNGFTTS